MQASCMWTTNARIVFCQRIALPHAIGLLKHQITAFSSANPLFFSLLLSSVPCQSLGCISGLVVLYLINPEYHPLIAQSKLAEKSIETKTGTPAVTLRCHCWFAGKKPSNPRAACKCHGPSRPKSHPLYRMTEQGSRPRKTSFARPSNQPLQYRVQVGLLLGTDTIATHLTVCHGFEIQSLNQLINREMIRKIRLVAQNQ